MAKLDAYYTLCPLIDQQNLLGVKKDAEVGCAVVTLGRNIVIRYKLQDLKQISSWSSKERLSSEVIYDTTTNKYVAVFNEKAIKVWSADETTLDNVKKYKFSTPVNKILTYDEHPPILVLQNGATASLYWTLEKKNRKHWSSVGFLKENERLLDCQLIVVNNNTFLGALTKLDKVFNYILIPLRGENYTEEVDNLTRIELKRTSETLVGHVIIQDKKKAYLLSLWSHGRLYSYPLSFPSPEASPGVLVSVVKSINTNHPVVMVPLNESTIAMYGADAAEEGAVLVIYNVQFKIAQAIQKLKLYTKDAKLWQINDKLLLATNRHLAVVPFRLAAQKIGTMVGSSLKMNNIEINAIENDEIIILQESKIEHWNNQKFKTKDYFTKLPKAVAKQIKSLVRDGLDDADIQSVVMNDLIKNEDIVSIIWCLNNFKDLPENVLLKLLLFGLRTNDEVFKPTQNGFSHDNSEINDKINSRNEFLNKIFMVSNSDMYMLGYLKSSLKFDEVLKLLDYLIGKMDDAVDGVKDIEHAPNYKQLYEWTGLLLNSHYQQYLLSQDSSILEKLNKLNSVLDSHMDLLKDLENLRPMLKRVMDGKSLKITPKDNNKLYSIEDIKLY